MVQEPAETLLPKTVRPYVLTGVAALVAASVALILWRGPAILLDLSELGAALWCF